MEDVPKIVTEYMNEKLTKKVIEEEIIEIVFQLRAYKAFGPDGFNEIFYQKF